MGDGREIRCVRFREQPVVGDEAQQLDVVPLAERHDPAERHVPAEVDGLLRQLVRSGIAMQNPSHRLRGRLGDHCARVILSIAGVYDNRQSRFPCKLELAGKSVPLLAPRGIVVVIVEAAFTNRDSTVRENIAERVQMLKRIEADRVVRMNAGCVPDETRIRFRDCP